MSAKLVNLPKILLNLHIQNDMEAVHIGKNPCKTHLDRILGNAF